MAGLCAMVAGPRWSCGQAYGAVGAGDRNSLRGLFGAAAVLLHAPADQLPAGLQVPVGEASTSSLTPTAARTPSMSIGCCRGSMPMSWAMRSP